MKWVGEYLAWGDLFINQVHIWEIKAVRFLLPPRNVFISAFTTNWNIKGWCYWIGNASPTFLPRSPRQSISCRWNPYGSPCRGIWQSLQWELGSNRSTESNAVSIIISVTWVQTGRNSELEYVDGTVITLIRVSSIYIYIISAFTSRSSSLCCSSL